MSALRANLKVARSFREKAVMVLIALSRIVPGSGVLLWVICGADIPTGVKIGREVRFPHGAIGVVIHPNVVIGDRAVIYHGVTIGRSGSSKAVPVIGDDVRIGTGAVILGGITLGDGCRIGANAVVTRDVPAGATATGVPAKT